ncbi:MAG: fatty acid desaturase [bacterium]|nr:fatty acid desaturase [bacterium]
MNTIGTGAFRPRTLIGVIVVAVGALVAAPWYWYAHGGFSTGAWVMFAVLYIWTNIGQSLGYHRLWAHRTYECGKIMQAFLAIGASLAVVKVFLEWGPDHLWHHLHTDEEGDVHSPIVHPLSKPENPDGFWKALYGLWWAHMGWFMRQTTVPVEFKERCGFAKNPILRWQKRWDKPIVFLGFFIPFMVAGWDGLLLAGFVRVFVYWQATFAVNSYGHLVKVKRDAAGHVILFEPARNSFVLAILVLGEGYHRNHHRKAGSAYLGWKWYDFDPGKWILVTLEKIRLVYGIKKPMTHTGTR